MFQVAERIIHHPPWPVFSSDSGRGFRATVAFDRCVHGSTSYQNQICSTSDQTKIGTAHYSTIRGNFRCSSEISQFNDPAVGLMILLKVTKIDTAGSPNATSSSGRSQFCCKKDWQRNSSRVKRIWKHLWNKICWLRLVWKWVYLIAVYIYICVCVCMYTYIIFIYI